MNCGPMGIAPTYQRRDGSRCGVATGSRCLPGEVVRNVSTLGCPSPWFVWGGGLGQACPPCSFSSGTTCLPCPQGATLPECEGCEGGQPIYEKPSIWRQYGPEIVLAIVSAAAVAIAVPPILGAFGARE